MMLSKSSSFQQITDSDSEQQPKTNNNKKSISPRFSLRLSSPKSKVVVIDEEEEEKKETIEDEESEIITTKSGGFGVNSEKGIMKMADDAIQKPKRNNSININTVSPTSSSSPSSTNNNDDNSSTNNIPSPPRTTVTKSIFKKSSLRTGGGILNKIKNKNRNNNNNNNNNSDLILIDDDDINDPVMELFQARNTHRVRFALDGHEPKERTMIQRTDSKLPSSATTSTPTSPTNNEQQRNSSSSSAFNIKKFMKSALFSNNKNSNKHNNNSNYNEYELEMVKEMEADKDFVYVSPKRNKNQSPFYNSNNNNNNNNSFDDNNNDDNSGLLPGDFTLLESTRNELFEDDETDNNNREVRANVIKLLNKARRAQFLHYRYGYAVKCYVKALEILSNHDYPNNHPTVVKTVSDLHHAHFANASYINSANIVKLGIKYEDTGDLVRALKMYTIAYRIRRDYLSPYHPSLIVLLNMLGSIQIKRGEYDEAMAIYELALKDSTPNNNKDGNNGNSTSSDDNTTNSDNIKQQQIGIRTTNYLTRAVTYREMGTIYEEWGETDYALKMYHKSLDCMAEYKHIPNHFSLSTISSSQEEEEDADTFTDILHDLEETRLNTQSSSPRKVGGQQIHPSSTESVSTTNNHNNNQNDDQDGKDGMEMTFRESRRSSGRKLTSATSNASTDSCPYNVFFPESIIPKKRSKNKNKLTLKKNNSKKNNNNNKDDNNNKKKNNNNNKNNNDNNDEENEIKGDHTDIDVALTIHRIAQLHRSQQQYYMALPAFHVALRGMKYALGKSHPNVAAILGNIGNLQKEMGDMDAAYTTYQQVLAIESYRLGLSHPDVVVTLHNIATIDAARGNLEHALSLYAQVIALQRKLFGEDNECVAVTSACMGDVYERLGDHKSAVDCYEESLRIKIVALGRHSLEVARLLHKLGKLAIAEEDFHLAQSFISKAALVYKLNKLTDDDEWVVDVRRDSADVDCAIAMGRGVDFFEC